MEKIDNEKNNNIIKSLIDNNSVGVPLSIPVSTCRCLIAEKRIPRKE